MREVAVHVDVGDAVPRPVDRPAEKRVRTFRRVGVDAEPGVLVGARVLFGLVVDAVVRGVVLRRVPVRTVNW